MEPIKFKEQTLTYAENQPEYNPLPAHKDMFGRVTSCWKLTFRERIKILFTGKIWLILLSFNKPLTPSLLKVDYPFVANMEGESIIK